MRILSMLAVQFTYTSGLCRQIVYLLWLHCCCEDHMPCWIRFSSWIFISCWALCLKVACINFFLVIHRFNHLLLYQLLSFGFIIWKSLQLIVELRYLLPLFRWELLRALIARIQSAELWKLRVILSLVAADHLGGLGRDDLAQLLMLLLIDHAIHEAVVQLIQWYATFVFKEIV